MSKDQRESGVGLSGAGAGAKGAPQRGLRWQGMLQLPTRRRLVIYLVSVYLLLLFEQLQIIGGYHLDIRLIELALFMVLAGVIAALCADILHERTMHRAERDQARKHLDATLRVSLDGIFVTRVSDGMILDISPGSEKIFGYKREEMIGRTTTELGLWLRRSDREAYIDRLNRNRSVTGFNCQFTGRGMEPFHAVMNGTILNYDHQACILNVVRAVEHEFQLRKLTEENNQLLQRINDTLPIAIARYDAQFRHIYVNKAATRMTGIPTQDILFKKPTDMGMMPEMASRIEALMQRVFTSGESETIDIRFDFIERSCVFRARFYADHDHAGVIRTLTSVTTDVTEEIKMLENLEKSRERYRFLAKNSTDMICRHDINGQYLYASPSSERLLGYRPDQLVGQKTYDLVHPDDIPQIDNAHRRVLSPGHVSTLSYRMRHADGSYVWLETTSQSVPSPEDPKKLEIITMSRDVSDRKATEAALAWELELNATMAMLSQFAVTGDDFDKLAELVLDAIKSMTHSTAACVMIQREDEQAQKIVGEGSILQRLFESRDEEHPGGLPSAFPRIQKQLMANDTDELMNALHLDMEFESGLRSLLAVPIFIAGHSVGVLAGMNAVRRYTQRDVEVAERMAELLALVISRYQAQAEHRKIETYYRAGAASSLDAFFMCRVVRDAHGEIRDFELIDVNQRGCELVSAEREQLVGQLVCERFPVAIAGGYYDLCKHVFESGQPQQREMEIDAADQGIHASWLQVMVVPLEDGVAVNMRDVTMNKLSEQSLRESREHYRHAAESNRRLLTEVNHRVRNNLAGLLSLVRLTSKNVMSVEDFAQAMKERIAAMSHVHNMLAQTAWSDLRFKDMLSSLSQATASHHEHRITLDCHGPDVMITPQQATPLAMMLSELFNNSVKHGAHSRPGGRIEITWAVGEHPDFPCCLNLHWQESGGPELQYPIRRSLGLQLIEGFVRFELAGHCDMKFEKNGVNHRFIIPLNPAQYIEDQVADLVREEQATKI